MKSNKKLGFKWVVFESKQCSTSFLKTDASMKNRRAFTLIELLVVISIIALLLSIMLPGLKRAKDSAKAVVCMSNVKQWGLAINMYTSSNKDRYWLDPDADMSMASATRLWMNTLADLYGNNDKFRVCPIANRPNEFSKTVNYDVYGSTNRVWRVRNTTLRLDYYGSYGVNHWINNVPAQGPWAGGWRNKPDCQWGRSDASGASNIPIIGDCAWYGGNPEADIRTSGGLVPATADFLYDGMVKGQGSSLSWYDMARFCLNRHNKTTNLSFMDGSARKIPLSGLWKLKWHKRSVPVSEEVKIPWLK